MLCVRRAGGTELNPFPVDLNVWDSAALHFRALPLPFQFLTCCRHLAVFSLPLLPVSLPFHCLQAAGCRSVPRRSTPSSRTFPSAGGTVASPTVSCGVSLSP